MHDKVYGDSILFSLHLGSASRHNDVCILHGRLDKLNEGWFYESVVGLKDTFDSSSTLNDVSQHTPRQSNIVICVHENFQVKQVIDLLVVETENALKHDQGRPLLR